MKWMNLALAAIATLGFTAPAFADKSAGDHVDDTSVTASVKAKLVENSDVKSRNINIETYQGRVQLAGFLDSQAEINSAVTTAKGVSGVKSVSNRLAVRAKDRSMGTTLDDTTMAGKVKAAIAEDDMAKGASVNVEVNNGVVLLSGFVAGKGAAKAAEAAAKKAGATKVLNYIDIK